jgi:hypothetical protein
MSAPPAEVRTGAQIDLSCDVANAQSGDQVTFTVSTVASGDTVTTLQGPIASNKAKATWTVDPGTNAIPLDVKITASLRGKTLDVGTTKILAGTRVSTLGWLDSQGRVIEIDRTAGKRVAAAGDTLLLQFDVDDGSGGPVKEPLDFTFILERDGGDGNFSEVGRFQDSQTGIQRFQRKFTTPNDKSVPATFRITLEVRRQGETSSPPSIGKRVSPPIEVDVFGPLVTSFVGAEVHTGSSHPTSFVALSNGQTARVFWDVTGAFDKVTITGENDIDVTGDTTTAQGSVKSGAHTIDPSGDPPDADGHYTIVASNQGVESPPVQIQVAAITDFALAIADTQNDSNAHALFEKNGTTERGPIEGVATPFTDPNHIFQGQVTPHSRVKFAWSVAGAKNVRVRFEVKNIPGPDPDNPSKTLPGTRKDLTDDLRASTGGNGSIEIDDPSRSPLLHAEITLFEDVNGKNGHIVARSIIHVRENFPMPRLDDLKAVQNGVPVGDGSTFDDWNDLSYQWTLGGSSSGNHLTTTISDDTGHSFTEEWKPAGDKRQKAITKPTGGPLRGKITAEAVLRNSFNEETGRKKITVVVNAGASFGTDLERVPRAGEHTPPRICEPFRLRFKASGTPPPTPAELAAIKWSITVDGKPFTLTPAPADGDKLKITKAPDEWFGKTVVFNATFPGKSVPASLTVTFDRTEAMEYLQLVEKVEAANPSFTPTEVVDALRRVAGYDYDLFQDMLKKPPAHDLVPTGALTKADIDRLQELSVHKVSGGVETGIAKEDVLGFPVAMGHTICGMSAGTMAKPRPRFVKSKGPITISLEPLYTVTITGDLGQTAVEFAATKDGFQGTHSHDPCTALIGKGSEATDAELVGDLDGWLLGDSVFNGSSKVSAALRAWYCTRGNETGNAADRFVAFESKNPGSPNPTIQSETKEFNFAYLGQHYQGQFVRANLGDPVAAKHVADMKAEAKNVLPAFATWLAGMKTREAANKKAADDADAADATDGFK